jgi:hypothetical protein
MQVVFSIVASDATRSVYSPPAYRVHALMAGVCSITSGLPHAK